MVVKNIKKKNISIDPGPSSEDSSSGGGGSREYCGENDGNSVGMKNGICNES